MAGFPEGRESANCKLHLPREGQEEPKLPTETSTPDDHEKPIVRTYTIRKFDAVAGQVDVDFFIHEEAGPASRWALNAKPGDKIGLSGPGPHKLAEHDRDWFLFAGDMSALPALGANIEKVPADAKGHALLEILDEADSQDLPFPEGIAVQWLVNPHPDRANTVLYDAFKQVQWLEGKPYVWVAGESGAVKMIRQYLRKERSLNREDFYLSGYWQIGLTEDGHQKIKRLEKVG